MTDTVKAVVCEDAGPTPANTRNVTSAGRLAGQHPRNFESEGFSLSGQADAAGVLAGPTFLEPGAGNVDRQPQLLANPRVSAVPYGHLLELARAQIRRECRRWGFDWESFVADEPAWAITEIVHRRAVRQERRRGLDVRLVDIPTDTVLTAVRDVIAEWSFHPELRPTADDFRQEQARRGEKGRETQQVNATAREQQVLALVADGMSSNAAIAERVGVDRVTVWRIRSKADATTSDRLQEKALPLSFPAPDIPPAERWSIWQFTRQTGRTLSAADAYWLADVGRCYEEEGRVTELMDAIRASAGVDVHHPWAYLQRCVANRGDAWTISPQLLADILTWAGQDSLQYALTAIGGGYIRRPLAYLRRTLQYAVGAGQRPSGWPERPVAMAVAMARQWAPELVIVAAEDAVVAEDTDKRSGYVDSFRRRFGRLPWETETVPENAADLDVGDADVCCIGLKGLRGDDSNYQNSEYRNLESSPGSVKAAATRAPCEELEVERRAASPEKPDERQVAASGRALGPSPWEREKIERPLETGVLPDSDEILRPESDGEARKLVQTAIDPLVEEKVPVVFEHGRCRHPLASLMASAMVLDDVVLVDCAAGCGHRIYSGRGPLECPCHWPPVKAAWVARALQVP